MFQFSHSVVSHSANRWPAASHLPCPSPTPGACSNSCPSSQWCHSIISFSDIPFSACLQSFPASGSFPMSPFSSHQVAKVLELQLQNPSYEYSELISSRIDWLDLLAVQETLKCLLQHHSSKPSILHHSAFFTAQPSQPFYLFYYKINK